MCSRNGSAALVGKVAQIKEINEPMTYGAFMTVIRSDYSDFLFLYFQSNDFREQVSTGKSSTMNQITQNMLDKISVPFPDEATRNRLSKILHQADKSEFVGSKSQFIEMFFNERHPLQQLKPHIEVIRGVSYKPSDVREDATASSVIILRSNNINNGVINNEDIVYVDSDRVSDSQFVSVGDIIMCGSNGSKSLVGKAAMIDSKPKHQTSFGAFCLGIRCKRTILSKYLSTYFQSSIYRNKIESLGSGTNILNIKPEHIYNLEIPIPSIEEQKLFVSLAQQADKSEYELRTTIDEIDAFIQWLTIKIYDNESRVTGFVA
jgi:restriction endonuclease S subunit